MFNMFLKSNTSTLTSNAFHYKKKKKNFKIHRTVMLSIKTDWVAIKTVKYMQRIRFRSEFPIGKTKYLTYSTIPIKLFPKTIKATKSEARD